MASSPTEVDPARLRLAASAARREALSLHSEWGTPLARIPPMVAEAFQSPFGEAARYAIGGWEHDLNDLGNHLFRLCNACEAMADEEEGIAKVLAGGFPPPTRHQDIASAFVAWERRSRQHRPFVPSPGGGGGFVAIDPHLVRLAAQRLLDARHQLDASYRRLTVPLADVGLEAPEELRWVVEDAERLAHELRRRADAVEATEAQARHSAATALSISFTGLLAPKTTGTASKAATGHDPPRAGPQLGVRDKGRQGRSDARRILDKLRSGLFRIPDPDAARRITARAARTARENPAYAAGFLRQLGPKGLAKLLDDGSLDPCDLAAVVARASTVEDQHHQPPFGADFLNKALGKNRATAARRAAVLGSCDCPEAPFHPAWTARAVEVLYRGPDIAAGPYGDSRRWFRGVATNLLSQLDPAPAGLAKEAEDALEYIIAFASDHPLDSAGKFALARLLARPDRIGDVATRLAGGRPASPDAPGFKVGGDAMRRVVADIAADKIAGPVLYEAASRYASGVLDHTAGPFLANRGAKETERALAEVGALIGALGSRSYDPPVALDVAEVGTNAVKDVLERLAGATLDVVKSGVVASVVVEGGKTVLFALGPFSARGPAMVGPSLG
ncbi:MAG: hypothetical protein ACRD0C_15895 [Acidimicrobiia bacterium]